jgi:hypothetical protein
VVIYKSPLFWVKCLRPRYTLSRAVDINTGSVSPLEWYAIFCALSPRYLRFYQLITEDILHAPRTARCVHIIRFPSNQRSGSCIGTTTSTTRALLTLKGGIVSMLFFSHSKLDLRVLSVYARRSITYAGQLTIFLWFSHWTVIYVLFHVHFRIIVSSRHCIAILDITTSIRQSSSLGT